MLRRYSSHVFCLKSPLTLGQLATTRSKVLPIKIPLDDLKELALYCAAGIFDDGPLGLVKGWINCLDMR
jgi:hypothetical protein